MSSFCATIARMRQTDPKFVWREVLGTSMVNGSDFVHVHLSCGHKVVMRLDVVAGRKCYNHLLETLSISPEHTKIQCYLCPQEKAGEGFRPVYPSE